MIQDSKKLLWYPSQYRVSIKNNTLIKYADITTASIPYTISCDTTSTDIDSMNSGVMFNDSSTNDITYSTSSNLTYEMLVFNTDNINLDTALLHDFETYKKKSSIRDKHKILSLINHNGATARSFNKGRSFSNAKKEELVALQLLRSMVSHENFKRYLKHNFIIVNGNSGLAYQIMRGMQHMKVWKNGVNICELCINVKDVPPTDQVISKMIMIEYDEIDIWRKSNIYWRQVPNNIKKLSKNTIQEDHLKLVA